MSLSLALRLQRVLDRLWNAESLLFSLNLRSPFRNMQGSENESQKNYGTNMIKGKLFPRGTASGGGRKEPDFSHEKPFLPLLAREACWSFSRIQHKVDTSTSSLGKESQPLFFFHLKISIYMSQQIYVVPATNPLPFPLYCEVANIPS